MEIIKKRKTMRYSSMIIGKHMLVQCGRYIKVAAFKETNTKNKKTFFYQSGNKEGLMFKQLNMNFPYQIEVSKILPVYILEEDNEHSKIKKIESRDMV